jgi:hypothetical protein
VPVPSSRIVSGWTASSRTWIRGQRRVEFAPNEGLVNALRGIYGMVRDNGHQHSALARPASPRGRPPGDVQEQHVAGGPADITFTFGLTTDEAHRRLEPRPGDTLDVGR